MNRRRFLKAGLVLGAFACVPFLGKMGAKAFSFSLPGKRARYFRVLACQKQPRA